MAHGVLQAHSLAEAFFYLSINPCPECGTGAREAGEGRRLDDVDGAARVEIETTCRNCGAVAVTGFELADDASLDGQATPMINPSPEPSRIIDVAQWLTLFRMTAEATAKEPDKLSGRLKGIEAALCLEEALKFYDDVENDLPPKEAFFSDTTRQRLSEHPEQFSRQRLIGFRAKLPAMDVMQRAAESRPRREWWRFWE